MSFRAYVLFLIPLILGPLVGCDSHKKKAGPPLPPLMIRDVTTRQEVYSYSDNHPNTIQMVVMFRSPPGSPERAQEQSTYARLEAIAAEYSDVVMVVRADLSHIKGNERFDTPGILVVKFDLHGTDLAPGGTGRPSDAQIRAMLQKHREKLQSQASANPAPVAPVSTPSQPSGMPAGKGELPFGMEKRGSR